MNKVERQVTFQLYDYVKIIQIQVKLSLRIISSLLAATFKKEIDESMIGIQALEYHSNRKIYTLHAGAAGMLLQSNEQFTIGKLKSSLLS